MLQPKPLASILPGARHCTSLAERTVDALGALDVCGLRFPLHGHSHSQEPCKGTLQPGIQVGIPVYASLLRSCSSSQALAEGRRVHAHIISSGLERILFLGNILLEMYDTCEDVESARALFATMPQHDLFSWNFMIRAYARHGRREAALQLVELMQGEGVLPDRFIFASILSACDTDFTLAQGKRIHARIVVSGFESDVILGTAIVNMYGKCGRVEDAWIAFQGIPDRDVVSWNAMIATYAQKGLCKEAFNVFDQMLRALVMPNKVTFLTTLSLCACQKGSLEMCDWLHSHVRGSGLESDVSVGNALVNMYGKCGSLDNARKVFDTMANHDVVSWNSIIVQYAQNGRGNEALALFEQMKINCIFPDKATFVSILDASGTKSALDAGKRLHAHILGSRCESDLVVGTALVYMYGKCGSLQDAKGMFHRLRERDVILWNAMISICAQNVKGQDVFQLFDQMQQEGILPNNVTFVSTVSVCASQEALLRGKQMQAHVMSLNCAPDHIVFTALVNMYGKCGSLEYTRSLFNEMPQKDAVVWNSMIAMHINNGQGKVALFLFDQMQEEGVMPDVVTFASILDACASHAFLNRGIQFHSRIVVSRSFERDVVLGNAIINMYGKCGRLEKAWWVFEQMQERDKVTYINLISACASNTAIMNGRQMYTLENRIALESDVCAQNALLNMHGKYGNLEAAQILFEKMLERDRVSWNLIIAAHAQQGHGMAALILYNGMRKEGFLPDRFTFMNILSACSRGGLFEEANHIFMHLNQEYGTVSTVDHYNCMIDLLGRAGQLDDARYAMRNMPVRPTVVSWLTLLGACKIHLDAEGGDDAAKHVMELDPEMTAPYVALSNIYSQL